MTNAARAGVWGDLAGTEGGNGIVHSGMTQRTLNAHRLERPRGVERAGDADHRIQLEERERDRGVPTFCSFWYR
jgi:hypothetical protein